MNYHPDHPSFSQPRSHVSPILPRAPGVDIDEGDPATRQDDLSSIRQTQQRALHT